MFTVMLVSLSLTMMRKLRIRFEDFYVEYGCFLWTVVIIQAISVIIQTSTNILLYYNESFYHFYNHLCNDVTYVTLAVIYNIVAVIVPMLTQLSCLIFGWIRYRKEAN